MPRKPPTPVKSRVQKHRKKLANQGRRQVAVHLTEPAITALDSLAKSVGMDRSRALDALLLGHVTLPKRKKSTPLQVIESADLFGHDS